MEDTDTWSDEVVALVAKAVLAPSSHNTQPWFFLLGEPHVDLLADRTRALPVNDPEGRELTISCGCALMNLSLAAAASGYHVENRLFPDPDEPDWFARVSLTRGSAEPVPEAELARFIEMRRTCRTRFESRPVAEDIVAALTAAAQGEGAWLRPLLGDSVRDQAIALVVEGDAEQWGDPEWRRELAAWMHRPSEGDGLPVSTLMAPVTQMIVRNFDMGGGRAPRIESSPKARRCWPCSGPAAIHPETGCWPDRRCSGSYWWPAARVCAPRI